MRQKIKKIWFYGTWLFKFSFLTIFYLIVSLPLRFSKKHKNLWLIGERPDEARDNGYWLYKYIIENHPEVNVRFVLAKTSVDYAKMPRKDLIIEPGSAKHYISYILCKYSISTHMHGVCPGKSFCIPFLPFMRKKKTIFLQHGIILNSVNLRGKLDAVVASSKAEQKLIEKSNPQYKDKIHTVGLCRYDSLLDTSSSKKIILVMPTFRKYLRDIARLKNADEVFRKTAYYQAWNSVLSSDALLALLEKYNYELIFFPHREMQFLSRNFRSNFSHIKIGRPGEYDVQTLLKSAKLLITDYSSVFFDFTYMKKPVIFYQFDQEDFFTKHYASSGNEYPLGDIFTTTQDLVAELENTIKTGCKMKKTYVSDSDKFYAHRDQKNCERNFNLIAEIK